MNTADTLPFSSTTNNLTGAFSAESRHVFVIFTLLSELDVPDEGLLSAGKRSNKNGNRIGTIVNADNAETCAQYAKKIAMQKPSFLLPIWNNVAATAADDAPQGSDVDILLHFGDGSKSKVHIRHVENKSSNDPIILLELSIATKVLIGNDSCVVESKDVLYEHASLAMHGKPEEFYIYPSSKVSNFLYCSDLTKEAVGSNANESTDNVLILFEDDSIKQIQQNVDTRTTLELMDEDRSVRKVDAVVSNNNTNANANANTKTKTNTSKQETMTGKGQDVVTSKKKDRKRKVMQTQQDDEISIEKEETLGGKNQDVVTPTKKGRKRKVMQTQQDDEIIHDTKETPSKDNSTSKKIRSIDQSPKPSVKTPSKKSKSKKDKNEPKRAPSAYILFCNDKRAGIIEDNPNVDPVDIMKKMGELWRAAGDDVKAKYAEKSKKLSTIANEKIQAYRKDKQEASQVDREHDSDGGENDNEKSKKSKSKQKRKKAESDGTVVEKKQKKSKKSKSK